MGERFILAVLLTVSLYWFGGQGEPLLKHSVIVDIVEEKIPTFSYGAISRFLQEFYDY